MKTTPLSDEKFQQIYTDKFFCAKVAHASPTYMDGKHFIGWIVDDFPTKYKATFEQVKKAREQREKNRALIIL